MRLLKIIYFEIKQLYSRWFIIIWLAMATYNIAIAALLIKHDAETVLNGVFYELSSFILVLLLMALSMVSTRSFFVKSAIDFVFTTQMDPVEYYIARAIANGLIYLITFVTFTAPLVRPGIDAAYYVLILLLLTSFFTLFTANALVLPQTLRLLYISPLLLIIILGFISPRLSPIYGFVNPSPTYVAYALALTAVVVATIPRRRIRDLASNAYEVLDVSTPLLRRSDVDTLVTHLPRSPWGIIWFTSTKVLIIRGERTNILKVLVPLSTVTAIVYLVITVFLSKVFMEFLAAPYQFGNWQGDFAVMTFIIIYLYLFMPLMFTISGERLWLSMSIDPARYFRLRMLARTLIVAITLLPWVIAYIIQGIYFRPAIYLAPALIAAILITPILSWLLAAYVGIPQVRELNIAQRPVVFTLRRTLIFALLFASLGIFMAPYFLALTAEVTHYGLLSTVLNYVSATFTALLMIVSVALFYLVVLSEKGRGVWSWLVNRLSEVGYV